MNILQTCVVAAGIAACVIQPAAAAAEAKLPPVLTFAKKAQFKAAKLSPNGEYLAVTIPNEAQTILGIIDLKTQKVTGTLAWTHGEHVADFWWVAPDRVIATPAKSFGPLDQLARTGELYGMNADGKQRQYLFGYQGVGSTGTHIGVSTKAYAFANVIHSLPDDPRQALVLVYDWDRSEAATKPSVERIDVYTGQRQRVTVLPMPGIPDVVTDDTGRLRFATIYNEKEQYWLFSTLDGKQWQPVQHPAGTPQAVELHSASADGKFAYMTVTAGGRTCLQEYAIGGGGFRDLDCTQDGSLGAPVLALDDWRPIGLGNGRSVPNTRWLDTQHRDARFLQGLEKAFGGQRVAVTSMTQDRKLAVVQVEGDQMPGDYYLVNRETKKATYLISRRPWVGTDAITPVEAIRYTTRDGATIPGYLTARGGTKARKMPMVLLVHGGPHYVYDAWEWNPEAQLLASRGYAVLQVNYRGSGGYGIEFQRAGYRKWGTLMQDDLTDAVRWAIDQGIADKDRICIMGGSYGGYAAVMSPTREPDLYRCAIALAGAYDLVEQADDTDTSDSMFGRAYLQRVLGDDRLKADQSPVTHIAKLKIPVLIAHGTSDKRVPFSQAKILRKALEQHQKPYEWMEFQGEQHGFEKDENSEAFLAKTLAFLEKHIGSGAPGK